MGTEPKTREDAAQASSARTGNGEGALVALDLRALTRFQEGGPGVRVLADTGAARVVLFAFKAGQTLKEHSTSSQILVQVVRGQITFTAGQQSAEGRAGALFVLEARVPHSIMAHTNAVVLVTMTPSPAQHSLEAEVFSKTVPIVVRKEAEEAAEG
jgi:quercetin dioxygenase-like cupin family protein